MQSNGVERSKEDHSYEPRVLSLSYTETKVLVLVIWVSVALGGGGVIALVVIKQKGESNITFASNQQLTLTNIVLSSISLLVLTITGVVYTVQLLRAAHHYAGRSWLKDVGGRHILLTLALLISLWLTSLTSLIPSALITSTKCWFNAYVTTSVWTTVQWLWACRLIAQSTVCGNMQHFFAVLCIQINEWVPVAHMYPWWCTAWRKPGCTGCASIRQLCPQHYMKSKQGTMAAAGRTPSAATAGLQRFDHGAVEWHVAGDRCQASPDPKAAAPGPAANDIRSISSSSDSDDVLVGGNPGQQQVMPLSGSEGHARGRNSSSKRVADELETSSSTLLANNLDIISQRACSQSSLGSLKGVGLADTQGSVFKYSRIVADCSWLHHGPILMLWLLLMVFAILMAVFSGNLHITFNGALTVNNMIARFVNVFGEDTRATWQAIAADPGAKLGNRVETLQNSVNGTHISYTVWQTNWTSVSQVPFCHRPDWLAEDIHAAALCQVSEWFRLSAVPLLNSYCSGLDGNVPFLRFYDPLASQLRYFRSQLNLPEQCSTRNDPTCSPLTCVRSGAFISMFICVTVCYFLYVVLFLVYMSKALRMLKTLPYMKFRLANIMTRLQLRESLVVMLFSITSLLLLAFLRFGDCNSQLTVICGIVPVQLVCVSLTCVKCYCTCLHARPKSEMVNNDKLSQFAWTEDDAPSVVASRGFEDKPVFVMETCLKMLYYATASYRLLQEKDPAAHVGQRQVFDVRTALELDGLTQHTVIRDPVHDAELIAGWNTRQLVIAFRGTMTMRNVLSDARAWPVRHYDPANSAVKHKWGWTSRATLHQGFASSWLSVRDKVLSLVRERVQGADRKQQYIISFAGHSLGGALCTLAAWDTGLLLRDVGNLDHVKLRCYTFGCPRPGNHTFAHLYKQLVPDTWDVANDQDVVPKMTKWMRVYKRTGQRVFIRKHVVWRDGLRLLGDIIACPSWVELNALQNALRSSVQDHMLAQYAMALIAIVAAQFDPCKALDGGLAGAQKLLATPAMQHLLRDTLAQEQLSTADSAQLLMAGMQLPGYAATAEDIAAHKAAQAPRKAQRAEFKMLRAVLQVGSRYQDNADESV